MRSLSAQELLRLGKRNSFRSCHYQKVDTTVRHSIFAQPYLASNDNRSVAGIDCPVCAQRNKAIPLKTVPANQAVRIFTDSDLQTRVLGTTNVSYGDPRDLPDELRGSVTITFWRCENCDLVFHREFREWSLKELQRQVYNAAYPRFLPNVNTDVPRYRAMFLRNLFAASIKNIEVLICESKMGSLAQELFENGINTRTYQLFNPDFNPASLGTFDLICMFMVLERIPDPEQAFRSILRHCRQDFAILVARYPFNYKNEKEHTMLSPRNGFYRMYSEKSLELLLDNLKLNYIHLTPSVTLIFRKLPSFAAFLENAEIDEERLMAEAAENAEEEEKEETTSLLEYSDAHRQKDVRQPSTIVVGAERIAVRKTLFGMTAYNPKDQLVGRSLDNYGEYLRGDQELLQQLIRPSWTVFDVAANIGLHCMVISPLLTEGGVIHAFEPYEESYQLLGTNILLNGLHNVRTYPNALGAISGTTRIAHVELDKPGSMVAKGWSEDYEGPEVLLDSIDQLEPHKCDFIHVCVPECEPDILRGADKTLARFKPALLVNCVSEDNFKAIFNQLRGHGYRMYWHIQPFYQADNFFDNDTNVFNSAGVAKILALPSSKEQTIGLTEITTEDDWIA